MLLEIRRMFFAVFNVEFCWHTLVVRLLWLFGLIIFAVDAVANVVQTDWQAVSGFGIEVLVDHTWLADFDYTTRDYVVASSTDGRSLARVRQHLDSRLLQLWIDKLMMTYLLWLELDHFWLHTTGCCFLIGSLGLLLCRIVIIGTWYNLIQFLFSLLMWTLLLL